MIYAEPPTTCPVSTHGGTAAWQDVSDVGSIVWDAEIILAHYLDRAYGSRLSGMRVLELGAGTGLAGIVRALWSYNLAQTLHSCITRNINVGL